MEKKQTIAKNVFNEINTQYFKLTNCKKDMFLKKILPMVRESDLKTFKMTLTLLPHQILILPETFRTAISTNFLSNYKVYDNKTIR